MRILYILRWILFKEKYKLKIILMQKVNEGYRKCQKLFVIHFIPVPGPAQSIQTGPGTSLCSCSDWSLSNRPHSLFLLTIPKQDQESLSVPCPDCLCQAGASFRSGGTMKTQNCYTSSWSCESLIFYGSPWFPPPSNRKVKTRNLSYFLYI